MAFLQKPPEEQENLLDKNFAYYNSLRDWNKSYKEDPLDYPELEPYQKRLEDIVSSFPTQVLLQLSQLLQQKQQLQEENNRLSNLHQSPPRKCNHAPLIEQLEASITQKDKELQEARKHYQQAQKHLKDSFALLPGVENPKQLKQAIKGLQQTERHSDELVGTLQASIIEWENVGLSLLHSPDQRPPTPQEADIQAREVVAAFKASVEELNKLRALQRQNKMPQPEEGASSKPPTTSGMMPEPLSPEQVSTIWNQLKPHLRMTVPEPPQTSVELMEALQQADCRHPRQAALALGDPSASQEWDMSLEQMELYADHCRQCPSQNPIPAQAAPTFTPQTKLFKASEVPKFTNIREYEAYRTNLNDFLDAIDEPPPQLFNQALRRILQAFEDPNAAIAKSGWDTSNLIGTNWQETRRNFFSALDKKFESKTAMQDALIAWKQVKPREGETPAQFFIKFEGAFTQLRNLQARKGVPIVSDNDVRDRLLTVLPRYLVDSARDSLSTNPDLPMLENREFSDLRNLFEQKWAYTPKPAKSTYQTDSRYKTGSTRITPAQPSNGPNRETERQCGLICSYDTSPPVPNNFRGPLFPDSKDPQKTTENHRRRIACANAEVCLYCRRPRSEHKASGPRFKAVLPPPANVRHTPAIQSAPLPESRQIEAPPSPSFE